MKPFKLFIILLFVGLFSNAQEEKIENYTITVTIENILNEKGTILTGLHNAETFMKGMGLKNDQSKIKGDKVTVVFKDVPKGEYAIISMHDENDNKQMDMENGMPKESYGMSGGTAFGPPTFGDAKFKVTDKDLDILIRF